MSTSETPQRAEGNAAVEGERLPMRGIVLFQLKYHECGGWELISANREGRFERLWNSPKAEQIYAYTGLQAALNEHPEIPKLDDSIVVRQTLDDNKVHVVEMTTWVVAQITADPDAKVGTLNWNLYRSSDATIRSFGKMNNAACKPLRDVLARAKFFWPWNAVVSSKGSLGGRAIENLAEFDVPPVQQLIEKWADQAKITMKPLEFIDVTAESTTKVSRVPIMLKLYGMKRFPFCMPSLDFATTTPERAAQRELIDGFVEIVNECSDPTIVEWMVNDVLKPQLHDARARAPRFARPDGGTIQPASEYIRRRLPEIDSVALRDRVEQMLGPVREIQYPTITKAFGL